MNSNEFDTVPVFTPTDVREINGNGNPLADQLAQGRTIEQIRSKYHTAVRVQVPRDLEAIKKRCIEEARHGGDEFGWAWPVDVPVKDAEGNIMKDERGRWITKQEIIEGRSIGLAMAAVRNWGNCTVESYVTNDLPDRYELLGVFVDFETGFTSMRPYTIRKASRDLSEKQKGKASQLARQEDMTLQIGLSKCIRNVILGAVPSWLTEQMHDESKKYAEKRIAENLPQSIERAVFAFSKLGVTEAKLEFYLEGKRAEWTATDVVKLRGLLQAVKDGDLKVAEMFAQVKDGQEQQTTAQQTPPQPKAEAPVKTESVPAPTSAETSDLTQEQTNKIDYCINALVALAGNNPDRRKELNKNWTQGHLTTVMHLRNRPDLIDYAYETAMKDAAEEGVEVKSV